MPRAAGRGVCTDHPQPGDDGMHEEAAEVREMIAVPGCELPESSASLRWFPLCPQCREYCPPMGSTRSIFDAFTK